MPEDSHFKGRDAIQHVAEVQAQGKIESTELHGTEPPGYLSAAADAIRDSALFILLIWIPIASFQMNMPKLMVFGLLCALVFGWMLWKCGRSAWLGWSRLERLHRILEQERWEIQHHRPQEREELRALYSVKGLEGKLLEDVLDVLMADDNRLLRIMIEEEMGISLETHDHPLKQALGTFLGIIFSAFLCLMGFFAHSIFGLPIAALISVGVGAWLSAYYAQNRIIPAIVWNVGLAALAAGTAYYLLVLASG